MTSKTDERRPKFARRGSDREQIFPPYGVRSAPGARARAHVSDCGIGGKNARTLQSTGSDVRRGRRDVDGYFAHHFWHINVSESRFRAADVKMERREIDHIGKASAGLFEERAHVLIG